MGTSSRASPPTSSACTCACGLAHLAVELCNQVHAVHKEELRQIALVQTQLLVHREVCPPLIKLENNRVVRSHSPDPSTPSPGSPS